MALRFPNLPSLFPFGNKPKDSSSVAYASFSARSFAMTFDLLLLFVLLSPVFEYASQIVNASFYAQQGEQQVQAILTELFARRITSEIAMQQLEATGFIAKQLVDYGLQFVVSGAVIVFAWLRFSTTPGLWLLRLYVADAETGGGLSLRQCVIRYIITVLAVAPFMLGMLWMFFNPRKQALQDILAGTVMLRRKFKFEIAQAEEGADAET